MVQCTVHTCLFRIDCFAEFRCSFLIDPFMYRTKRSPLFSLYSPLDTLTAKLCTAGSYLIFTRFAYLKMSFSFLTGVLLAICFLSTDRAIHRLHPFSCDQLGFCLFSEDLSMVWKKSTSCSRGCRSFKTTRTSSNGNFNRNSMDCWND